MTTTAARLLSEVLLLSDDERATIAARLMDSLERPFFEFDEALATTVQRRVDEIRSGAVHTIPWETARQMILGEIDGPGPA